ncbi:MAG: Holliday junction branch migration protein RuvA [Firmicutes bacterium]|jgi:Holliday junction DNA helicase RuvA|nr:Holliday junction branch migration protein RuvA [Bacillota bacterium]
MIASLSGHLEEIVSVADTTAQISLAVNGVGYRVTVSKRTLDYLSRPESEVHLKIYTHIREAVFSLYGFITSEERAFFELLLTANGVGPSLAMSFLALGDLPSLISALVNSDLDVLTKIPGVGKKTAQRLVIELGEKLAKTSWLTSVDANFGTLIPGGYVSPLTSATPISGGAFLVAEALRSLGYGDIEIKEALAVLAAFDEEELSLLSTEDMLRVSLQSLAKRK